MSSKKVFFPIVLISVAIFTPADGTAKCSVKDGFDRYELEGTWNYRAGINPWNIECGILILNRTSRNRFAGSIVGSTDQVTRKATLQAYVRDGIFATRFVENGVISDEYSMKMRTCNGVNEFSFELPNENLYFIFIKGTSVTPRFLKHYRRLGEQIDSRLQHARNTSCQITTT